MKVYIHNRTQEKAEKLVEIFTPFGDVKALSIAELIAPFDIIINSTSSSLSGDVPAIPSCVIGVESLCYDMMYSKEMTSFNSWALELGAVKAIDGLGMLVGQAAKSFELWRGVKPEVDTTIKLLREKIKSE